MHRHHAPGHPCSHSLLHPYKDPGKPSLGPELKELGGGKRTKHGDGREIKYLGVWYEAAAGWKKQRAVLEEKLRDLLAKVRQAHRPLPITILAINTTVIPALAYPMQVAVMPQTALTAWDREIRAVVRSVGRVPAFLPEEQYYLRKEDGGLGLRSLRQAVDIQRVKQDFQALNDEDYSAQDGVSTQAQVVRWMHDRLNQREEEGAGSVTQEVLNARRRLGVHVHKTPAKQYIREVQERDLEVVRRQFPLQQVEAYTDGSTLNKVESG